MVLSCRLLTSGIGTITVSLWYGIAGAYKCLAVATKGLTTLVKKKVGWLGACPLYKPVCCTQQAIAHGTETFSIWHPTSFSWHPTIVWLHCLTKGPNKMKKYSCRLKKKEEALELFFTRSLYTNKDRSVVVYGVYHM